MRAVVQHDEKTSNYLAQYARYIEHLSSNYKVIDIEETYLPREGEIAQCIEPSFIIKLYGEKIINQPILNSNEMILATIGVKDSNKRINAYYNMMTYTLEQANKVLDEKEVQWINCYSKNNEVNNIEYIKCIRYLRDLSSACHKSIIIYANIYIPNENYRYRTLTHKIINSYLTDLNGVLIIKAMKQNIYKYYATSKKSYEFYLEHTIYLENSLNETIIKTIPFLCSSQNQSEFRNIYKCHRQKETLYDDVFYQVIDPDQEIYVPLNLGNFKQPADYRVLGVEHVPLVGDYGMLYAKRSKFDELSEVIGAEVSNPYFMPIVSYDSCGKEVVNKSFSYNIAPANLRYKGSGVYIGIVAVDSVDYTNQALRTKDGKSRMACIWEQTRANDGTYFLKEQIDEALVSNDPNQMIGLPEGDSISTMMLGIAGGASSEPAYTGVATEAEFVVAKVNIAPEMLQKIYGGMPSKKAATMADVLVGTLKLINFARDRKKPLVLCIPLDTNISSHDGTFVFYNMLGLIAQWEYLTIIVSAGAEADKMHHYGPGSEQQKLMTVNMRVQKENQNVIGVVYRGIVNAFKVNLYPPKGVSNKPINLNLPDVSYLNGASIYTNGATLSFANGAVALLFRLENPQVGEWKIEITSDNIYPTNIWISQQELNEYTTLNPSDAFITIGAVGNTNAVMTIGGYDKDNMVVIGNSGRGYATDNRIQPFSITKGNSIIAPCNQGKWVITNGALPATSVMLGVVATVYEKCISEQVIPFPNTVIMKSILLGTLEHQQGVEYPNPSQGYGIYDVQTLNTLLGTPLVL